jgi:hypothetical protein
MLGPPPVREPDLSVRTENDGANMLFVLGILGTTSLLATDLSPSSSGAQASRRGMAFRVHAWRDGVPGVARPDLARGPRRHHVTGGQPLE